KPTDPALMLMTAGSSLGVAKVAQCLSQLFRQARHKDKHRHHFARDDPSGAKDAKLRLFSEFVVDGHQNALLSHILRGGTLKGLDLISDADSMLDEERSLLITSTEYKVTALKPGPLTLAGLKAALKKAPEPIDKARVRYTAPGQTGTQAHVFAVADLDSAFVRKENVRFPDAIQPRYAGVSMMVMDKLRTLL
ncbi:MAG: hypothetical protein H0X25_07205, partial [Acidobacteriales bacterium]|nr:hypothetical protein [Terriglobales bacterium]